MLHLIGIGIKCSISMICGAYRLAVDPVPRAKICDVPGNCEGCRPNEQVMVLDGRGCPTCQCDSVTPCRQRVGTCGPYFMACSW